MVDPRADQRLRNAVLEQAHGSEAALRQVIEGLPGVDEVGAGARTAALARRSIKRDAKRWALDTAVAMTDLTTLEGDDTPGRVRSLCAKAVTPDPRDPSAPPVAAVCVYPDRVALAKQAVAGSGVAVASVASGFPAGRTARRFKLEEVRYAVDEGADEIDVVIDRGAVLSGRWLVALEELRELREAAGTTHLKVILEVAELESLDMVRRASWLALISGADFIKTSTGKSSGGSTLPSVLVMLEAVRDFAELTGLRAGVKAAGGIRTAKDAIRYLVLVNETVGPAWLTPERFRFGASTLLNDLLRQRSWLARGAYEGRDYVTVD